MSYRLTPRAQRQLDAIYDYSADNWGVAQAEIYIRQLLQACDGLDGYNPLLYPIPGAANCFRKRVNRHLLIVERTADGVVILAILHGAMDLDTRIGDLLESEPPADE